MSQAAVQNSAVLFFDVDGTLTFFDPDNMTDKDLGSIRPSDAVVDAFHRLRANGHQAFICTGRPLWLISDALRELEPAGIVAMAGATLELEGSVAYEEHIDDALVRELATRVAATGGEALFETNTVTVALEPAGVEKSFLPGTPVVHTADALVEACAGHVGKVCINDRDLARVAGDDDFAERSFTVCHTGGHNRELSPLGMDKGVGVARALDCLGRKGNAGTFGFGDSGNDLGMLAAVETPVAMGNAMDEVKAAAAYVTDSIEDDGVVTALEHFNLI